MEGKRVTFFEVEPWEEEYFRDRLGREYGLEFTSERLSLDNIDEHSQLEYIATFIYSDLSQRILDKLPKLKGIATMSVGTDHIDLHETDRREIVVSNVPSYGPNTVAEHTMALLLALSRNIVQSVERTRSGEYDFAGLSGWDLSGKTLGVIGTGKIGALVAKAANGFGMKLIAYDPKPSPELESKYGVQYLTLPEIYHQADVITLHVPLTPESKHMLSRREFTLMKRGMVIINTARGGLIDVDALLEALDLGIVSQVGTDVLEEEGLLREEKEFFSRYFKMQDYQIALADHALIHHPKVLVTPHNAFNSKESLKNILETTVKNLAGMMSDDPINVVEYKR